MNILPEIIIVLILTCLNGFFSLSEIALISVRKTRIASLVKRGNRRAKVIRELQRRPENLFATIQIGISVITIVASAFAGANIAEELVVHIENLPFRLVADHAYAVSFVLVVVVLSYVNIVIGELVPKSLGLRYAENFSLLAAYPIWWLSKVSTWLVKFLNFSSNLILKVFRDTTNFSESRLSEEEIRALIYEGRQAGTIEPREHEILENVFELSDTPVARVMTSRRQIVAFDINESPAITLPKAIESGYTRIPYYEGNLDSTVGVLHVKDLLAYFDKDFGAIDLRKFLLPPLFVNSRQKTSEVLQRFQKRKLHQALVKGESGQVEGLVTLEDVLEELVGEISDEDDEATPV